MQVWRSHEGIHLPASSTSPGSDPLIANVLKCVQLSLDQFIAGSDPAAGRKVVLSNLIDPSGNPAPDTKDKIVMMLANVVQETTISTYNAARRTDDGDFAIKSPPIYINLYVFFYMNMSGRNYDQALGALTATISFFQQNPNFDKQNLPDLNPTIDRLTFEFASLDPLELNHVLGQFGVSYMPSVMYKVRLLPFDGSAVSGTVAAVESVQS